MTKAYSRTTWKNDSQPALNQTNLNKESAALDVIDDRVIELHNRTTNLEGYQTQAQQAVASAQNIASQMSSDAQAIRSQMTQDSTSYINQAKSWAIGEGYPARTNQATDNAKYYASMAEQVAVRNGYVDFYIDNNGHLIFLKTTTVTNLDFEVRNNTNLFVVVDDGN